MKSTAVITTILIILTSATAISALDPPDLLSATALSDSSVELVWRNIDTASTGFYILRKNPGSTQFNVTDSAEANDTSHIDSSLDAGTEYSFALQAFTASLVSDTSNNLSVKTLSIGDLFRAPSIDSLTWGFDSNTIAIEFYDSSNCEHGFYLQRSENFGPYEIIDSLVSTTPGYMGTVIWMDKNLNKNTWYSYIIEAIKYGGTDSLISNDFKIYTFHTETTLNALRNIYLTEKVSEFPIEYKGWAMHVGDTILLTETHAPDSGYTKISIADKKNPAILGYQKAADTIITSFDREDFSGFKPIRRFNYATRTNKLLARSRFGGVVNMYNYTNGLFEFIDSAGFGCLSLPGFLNDASIFSIQEGGGSSKYYYYSVISIEDSLKSISNQNLFLGQVTTQGHLNAAIADYLILSNRLYVINTGERRHAFYSFYLVDYSVNVNDPPVFSVLYNTNKKGYYPEFQRLAENVIHDGYVINGDIGRRHGLKHAYNNIFLDTLSRHAIILYDSIMSIFEYDTIPQIGIKDNSPFGTAAQKSFFCKANGSQILVTMPNEIRPSFINLYSVTGRLVQHIPAKQKNRLIMDIRRFSSGVYILQVVAEKKQYAFRIMISQ